MTGGIVLTYHELGTYTGNSSRVAKYWVTPDRFIRHLDTLKLHCEDLLRIEEFWQCQADHLHKTVAVPTFDDGRFCSYSVAFPILSDRSAFGTFFVNTATVGKSGYVDWPQLAEMARYGMSIQSHSHDHVYLSALNPGQVRYQGLRSKEMIEDRIGNSVRFFALPYGDSSERVRTVLLECGYSAVCSSTSSLAKPGARIVNRAVIYASTTHEQLQKLIRGDRAFYLTRRVRESLLYAPNKLLLHFRQREVPA